MEEEEEICRVCRSEGTPDQPLFHPCKCAGSIRHVHQDCLIEWLSHSKKKYCELCEHPFTFTPVYRPDMPEVLPTKLIFQQFRKKVAFVLLTISRAVLVSCIWLIILPYFTVWIWRLYFSLGTHISKRLITLQQLKNHITSTSNITTVLFAAGTSSSSDQDFTLDNETVISNSTAWFQEYKSRLTLQTFLSDCFEGQIITCIVVVIFVAVFLLREWIVQNIPMDVPVNEEIELEEEVEHEEEEDAALLQAQAGQQQQQEAEQPLRRPPLVAENRFDSFFDVQWEDQDINHPPRPPSPIAPMWYDEQEASTSSSAATTDSVIFHDKQRAASMPPSLSRSTSFRSNSSSHDAAAAVEAEQDAFDLRIGEQDGNYRRSASMEPFIDYQQQQSQQPASPTLIHRGHPPHAPRMRHAEASIPIRPIIEEEEDEEEEEQLDEEEAAVIAAANRPVDILLNEQQHQHHHRAAVLQPPPPPPPVPAQAANDDMMGDEDENIEEFEGVLEAIGMNGSLWSLLQNSALMGLLIALSLGAAVWMPYLIGMLFIMTETLDLIRIPLKLTRLVTDPLIDFLFMVCSDYVWPFLLDNYNQHIASTRLFEKVSIAFMYILNYIKDRGLLFADSSHTTLSDQLSSAAAATNTTATTNFVDHGIQYMTKWINETEPLLEQAFHRYQALATGQTAMDRFACIAVGYMIVIIVSSWYLTRTTHNNLATAAFGRTAQEAIRHQGIIFKVGMFITIELVLFPIVCGFLLDFSTMPLFKQATLNGRLGYLVSHPVPSVFLHWFLGTGFMFLFAVLVTVCREIVRPGLMWFIRDPNDPQFHPIREIVERPVFFQFKKIGASALIYLTVILVGVGGVVHCINNLAAQVLPLRWSLSDYTDNSNPLSVVPIDLIVIQVGIPAIVKYFEPKQTIKNLFIRWMVFNTRQLRLSSFIFGTRIPSEEGRLVHHTWWAWITRAKPTHYPAVGSIEDILGPEVSFLWEGQLLRVPRHDSVPIIDHRRMLVPVDVTTLEPIDETERILGHPASSALGGDEVNTTIVYSPPHFKQRLIIFVGFMWLSTSVGFCAMTILPVILGRYIFEQQFHVENEVHDIYSFVLGGSIFLLTGAFIYQFCKLVKEVWSQRTLENSLFVLYHRVKQWIFWGLRWTWFISAFGVVLPIAFGILIELYFMLPLRQLGQDSLTVQVMPMWSHGFACMVILHGFIQIAPDATARDTINEVFRGGIGEMNVKASFTKLLGPLLLISGIAVCLPFIIAFINMNIVARTNPELRVKLIQIAYPTALIGLGAYYLGKIGTRIGRRLTQSIREDNYLVGRTLHNLDH